MAIDQPRRDASERTDPADVPVADFRLPELRENKFLLFKAPRLVL